EPVGEVLGNRGGEGGDEAVFLVVAEGEVDAGVQGGGVLLTLSGRGGQWLRCAGRDAVRGRTDAEMARDGRRWGALTRAWRRKISSSASQVSMAGHARARRSWVGTGLPSISSSSRVSASLR